MNNQTQQDPGKSLFVSVVVPALNAPERTRTCLEALLDQTYPRDCYEIIVIDNGSTDTTPQVIRQYPVVFLSEDNIQSPYAARNRGIRQARGEIIAMIDINCTAAPGWLTNGIEVLTSKKADLIGGQVTFTFSPEKTAAEIFDSVSNVQIKRNIENRGVTKGGNLFVRRSVFDSIGLFPEHLRSGGDVLWTGQATRAGFTLLYAPGAEVFYPARKLFPLMKKQWRVGRGQPPIWMDENIGILKIWIRILRGFLPPGLGMVKQRVSERASGAIERSLFSIWLAAWACVAATNLGRINCLLNRFFNFPAKKNETA